MSLQQISQSQLTLLDYCPRKFQYIYLEQLGSPPSPEQQHYLDRGSQIHHLMQQQELHLPLPPADRLPESWSRETVQLYQTANALAAAVTVADADGQTRFRQSEYRLHYEFEGVLLTVVYDLLLLTDNQAHIVDWKTYTRSPDQAELAGHWQTKLYPFVLAATSQYDPANISLSYWFVQLPASMTPTAEDLQPNCLRFSYSDRLHQQIHQLLVQILSRLKQWLLDYEAGIPFPQTTAIEERCRPCPFAVRCARSQPATQEPWADLVNIETIAEVPLPATDEA